ncbi:MAG: helix-turn-helix domain-containing protein [Clostridia bacterium]|nr:helix-turn-helix domain-containing protein [Clostridia bacterium]
MERYFSIPALAGGRLFSCFFSERGFFETTKDNFTEDHTHASFEILFISDGQGTQWVGEKQYEYKTGDVFVFAPFVPHGHRGNRGEARVSLRFDVKTTKEVLSPSKEGSAALRLIQKRGGLRLENAASLHALLAMLESETKKENETALSGLMSAILSVVFEAVLKTAPAGKKRVTAEATQGARERRFLIDRFFDRLMDRNSSMEELCQQVHLSPTQLSRQIKEMYGVSFKQKLSEVRLAYIKYFLKHTDKSIREIADQNGFSDAANFSLFFKKHTGEAPSAYRRREQGEKK